MNTYNSTQADRYLVRYCIRDGENEYTHAFLFHTDDPEEIVRWVAPDAFNEMTFRDAKDKHEFFSDLCQGRELLYLEGGARCLNEFVVREVSPREANVLTKYFYV